MPKQKPSTIKLQVFKGREAKLNKTIFYILAKKGPQTIYDIHKALKAQRGFKCTCYASINKRVRSLEGSDFIEEAGAKKTKAGFEAAVYGLTTKSWLALVLDLTDLEEILNKLSEPDMIGILAALAVNIASHSLDL